MSKTKLIYLAAPYSSTEPSVVEFRVREINYAASIIFSGGNHVFSPISHTHPITEASENLEGSWEFWAEFDERMLSFCDEVHVLTLPGWKESKGVTAELSAARRMRKPIFLMVPTVVGVCPFEPIPYE